MIVKVCKKHGNLSLENIKQSIEKGKLRLRCKICNNEDAKKRASKYRKENREKHSEYIRMYREKKRALNPPKERVYKKRKIYDPNTKEIIRKCNIHGVLYHDNCFFKIKYGLIIQSQCRECIINSSLKRYEEKKQHIINKQKEYRKREKEKINEKAKIYREENKKLLAEKSKERRKRDPEKFKKASKISRLKRAEKIKINNKKYVSENKEKVRERAARYNFRMKEHLSKKRREWKAKVVKELTDGYVKSVLCSQGFESVKNITPELIDLKRISIKINRLKKIRRIENGKNKQHGNVTQ